MTELDDLKKRVREMKGRNIFSKKYRVAKDILKKIDGLQ